MRDVLVCEEVGHPSQHGHNAGRQGNWEGVTPMVANRAVRREVGVTRCKVEDRVLEIKVLLA